QENGPHTSRCLLRILDIGQKRAKKTIPFTNNPSAKAMSPIATDTGKLQAEGRNVQAVPEHGIADCFWRACKEPSDVRSTAGIRFRLAIKNRIDLPWGQQSINVFRHLRGIPADLGDEMSAKPG